MDPLEHRSVQLRYHEVDEEYIEVQKTYLLLGTIRWQENYGEYAYSDKTVHPIAVIQAAKSKDTLLPNLLFEIVIQQNQLQEYQI